LLDVAINDYRPSFSAASAFIFTLQHHILFIYIPAFPIKVVSYICTTLNTLDYRMCIAYKVVDTEIFISLSHRLWVSSRLILSCLEDYFCKANFSLLITSIIVCICGHRFPIPVPSTVVTIIFFFLCLQQ
jgi:hypothetical protein